MERIEDPLHRLAVERKEFGEWGGVNASIEASTTFTVMQAATLPAIFSGQIGPENGACYLYGRSFNPTVRYLARQIAALESTEAAYACSSGMAAISSTILSLCSSGDHIVASNTIYGGTFAFLKSFLPVKNNIHTTFVPINDLDAVAAAIQDNTKVLYTETVSNPTLHVADLPRLAEIAHAKGVTFVVDNTFTPLIITPVKWGADVVVHSVTKFISGASDIIAGAVCGSKKFIHSLMDLHTGPLMLLGPTMDPKVAAELSMRIPHLGIRMQAHSSRALHLAQKLHDSGAKVTYPGLPHHPHHHIFKRVYNAEYGFGGLVGLDMETFAAAELLMERLQNEHGFGFMAVSLGYFDTLMSCSGASTSSELSEEEKAQAGISAGYVRMSIGLTGTLDLRWNQLSEAYQYVKDKVLGKQVPAAAADSQSSDESNAAFEVKQPSTYGLSEGTAPSATTKANYPVSPSPIQQQSSSEVREWLQAQANLGGRNTPGVSVVSGTAAEAASVLVKRSRAEGPERTAVEDGPAVSSPRMKAKRA